MGHLPHRVSRSRRNDVKTCPASQIHMAVPFPVLGIEEIYQDGMLRKRGHRQRCDELLGIRGHQNPDIGTLLDQQPNKHSSLISCYATCDPDKYILSLKC